MASIARATLQRNNHLANHLLRHSQPLLSTGKAPRGNGVVVSLTRPLHSTSALAGRYRAPDGCGLPPHLRDQMCPMRHKISSSSSDESESECQSNNGGGGRGYREISTVKNTEEAVYFKVEMPGVCKQDVKLYLDDDGILIGKGIRKFDPKFDKEEDQDNYEEGKMIKTFKAGVGLVPLYLYNVSKVDAEFKDGVLKVIIPKVKDEERTDVKYIPIN